MNFQFLIFNFGKKEEGSLVIPLLIGVAMVAIVLGALVIGGKRDQEGRFRPAFLPQPTERLKVPVTQTEEKTRETGQIKEVEGEKRAVFLKIISPVNGATVSQNQVMVSGETVLEADVSINEKELVAGSGGKFSSTIYLEEGENYILVTAGNEDGYAEEEIVVNYEAE